MTGVAELLVAGLIIGIGGSALMDVWGFALRRGFAIPTLDYALLGRWIAYFPRGRFVHDRIAAAPAVRGERALGYLAHYTIGVAFALLLIVVWGMGWVHSPTIWPALVVGLGTVLAPWLVMQPAMGRGSQGREPRAPVRPASATSEPTPSTVSASTSRLSRCQWSWPPGRRCDPWCPRSRSASATTGLPPRSERRHSPRARCPARRGSRSGATPRRARHP